MSNRECCFEGCLRPHKARGYCMTHYQQVRQGRELKYIPNTPEERFWSYVDKSGECWVWVGDRFRVGYGRFGLNGKDMVAHRAAWTLFRGEIPEGKVIDHICHNKACVNVSHLRLATHQQNQEYQRGAYKNSRSGIRGVREKGEGRWSAHVGYLGREIHVGTFPTPEQAAHAAKELRAKLYSFPEYTPGTKLEVS